MLNNVSLALCSADGLVPSTLVPRPISAKFAGSRLQAGNIERVVGFKYILSVLGPAWPSKFSQTLRGLCRQGAGRVWLTEIYRGWIHQSIHTRCRTHTLCFVNYFVEIALRYICFTRSCIAAQSLSQRKDVSSCQLRNLYGWIRMIKKQLLIQL